MSTRDTHTLVRAHTGAGATDGMERRLPAGWQIRPAGPADLERVRALFRAYERELQVDLCFQGFAQELAGLPGAYAPPGGALLLAERDGLTVGVVGVRPQAAPGLCEMKRLYLAPGHRGGGTGRHLARAAIDAARAAGYRAMRLDTLAKLGPAIALYRSLGFFDCPAYYDNPLDEVIYMEMSLQASPSRPAAL